MDFLDKLYSSNYFGIGLFAVISFLVVAFLIVLFFGKKDEKKRKLEATQNLITENAFKETTEKSAVEIPVKPEPVAPIKLEPASTINTVKINEPVVAPNINSVATPINPVTPVMPIPPVNTTTTEKENDEFLDNLVIEEPAKEIPNSEPIKPIINPINNIVNEMPKAVANSTIELDPVKIELPNEPVKSESVTPIINDKVTPIIKEEEPKLQINEEPIINTYYQPTEKENVTEAIKVPNIDFDSLANSISKELDELEHNTHKYDEVKVTPLNTIVKPEPATNINTYNDVYIKEPIREMPKPEIDLPKKIDLPARKSE